MFSFPPKAEIAGGGAYSTHQSGGSDALAAGLLLGGLDTGLQVGGGVEVLALVPGAAALDVVHAHHHKILAGRLQRVGVAAVSLSPCAAATLKLPAHLGKGAGT